MSTRTRRLGFGHPGVATVGSPHSAWLLGSEMVTETEFEVAALLEAAPQQFGDPGPGRRPGQRLGEPASGRG